MSFTSFRSTRKVVVVDRFGRPTGEERILSNSPIDALFPDEKIVMVNWKYEGAKAPTAEELRRPIRHGGKEYRGDWAWGSSVKRGYTVGLTRDLLVDTGLLNCCEDAHRFGRAFLANGLYGGGGGAGGGRVGVGETLGGREDECRTRQDQVRHRARLVALVAAHSLDIRDPGRAGAASA